jgi:hypothetical protein
MGIAGPLNKILKEFIETSIAKVEVDNLLYLTFV